jgi:tetratricopeptide (TPR) repeat protein
MTKTKTFRQRRAGPRPAPATPPRPRLSTASWIPVLLQGAVIVLLTLVAYFPALRAGYIWDDDEYVTHNLTLRSLTGLRRIWVEPGATWQYYPLVHTSFWVQYQLWGADPFTYHLINVLLHALNAILFWRVLQRLSIPGAWAAALIFALHPVYVESVAWVTERKNVLSGAFFLSSLLAYLRFAPPDAASRDEPHRWRYYLLALALFVCALLSKTVTCSLPAVILILVWWKRGRLESRDLAPLLPFFAAGLVLGLTTAVLEKRHVGAEGSEFSLSFVERGLVAGRALWFYGAKLVWPRRLTFIYPRWRVDASSAWQYLFPLSALAAGAALWTTRARIGRGPLAAVLVFVATLAPALGFIDVYPMRFSFVADHFQYLASMGPIGLGVALATSWAARYGVRGRRLGEGACAAVCAVLGLLTWGQTHVYKDLDTLWRDTLAKNPDCWMAHNNLGFLLKNQGRLDEAVEHFNAALRVKPDHLPARYNLGLALARQGKLDEAISQYEEVLREWPRYADAHNSLGLAFAEQGKLDLAVVHYREALSLEPTHTLAHFNLGLALQRLGNVREATEHFEASARLDPSFTPARRALANLSR